MAQTFFLKFFFFWSAFANWMSMFLYIPLPPSMLVPPDTAPPPTIPFLRMCMYKWTGREVEVVRGLSFSSFGGNVGVSSINLYAFMWKNRPIFVYTCTERDICIWDVGSTLLNVDLPSWCTINTYECNRSKSIYTSIQIRRWNMRSITHISCNMNKCVS